MLTVHLNINTIADEKFAGWLSAFGAKTGHFRPVAAQRHAAPAAAMRFGAVVKPEYALRMLALANILKLPVCD